MKGMKSLLVVVCMVGMGFAQDAATAKQSTSSSSSRGILGYLDPVTGAFRPARKSGPSEVPAVTPTTGKFVFNISIAVNSGLASTAKITCAATAETAESASGTSFVDEATATATRSGSTATCTVNIPYGWYLQTASKDAVALEVSVTASSGTTTLPAGGTSAQVLEIAVPTSGSTTTETINTAI